MGTTGQSITLANSIIGVGILAMPFCFQQCGILLATIILIMMGLVSRLCCYFLFKSALIARRRNFEFLAFHVFGSAGKFAVEVGIIGFLMGTCIAYFVVVGDLGPQIVSKMFNINQSDILRTSIMVIVSLVCVLPLGLLRNVDSFSNVSAATIGFYFCLVMKVIAEAATQLLTVDWQSRVEMWKPSGVLQCVPIFSMALFCQTQLFEIFESLPSLSLEKMNVVTKNAINICTCVYFTLGLFGYIAFNSQEISGNILMSLSPTMASDVIKLGFVMSLAFSFPLIIFPCRASLYSLLYKKVHTSHHDHIINHSIPESSFRRITVCIVGLTLGVSLLLPNIELVLGLVGSTIGVLVCLVFPAACFVSLTFKNTNERVLAKCVIVLGLIIMILGTYANLQAAENQIDKYDDKYITKEKIDKIVEDFFEKMEKTDGETVKPIIKIENKDEANKLNGDIVKESVVLPPNPVPPESQSNEKNEKREEGIKNIDNIKEMLPKPIDVVDKVSETHPKNLYKANGIKPYKIEESEKPKEEIKPQSNEDKINMIKQQKLIETIKQHGEEQKELIKEQKEILHEIIKTKQEIEKNKNEAANDEAKKIAVESIKQIANIAIQSLAGVSDKPGQVAEEKKTGDLVKLTDDAVHEIAQKAVETIEAMKEIKDKPIKHDNKADNLPKVPALSDDQILNNKPNLNNAAVNNQNIQNPQIQLPSHSVPHVQNDLNLKNLNAISQNDQNVKSFDSKPAYVPPVNVAQPVIAAANAGKPALNIGQVENNYQVLGNNHYNLDNIDQVADKNQHVVNEDPNIIKPVVAEPLINVPPPAAVVPAANPQPVNMQNLNSHIIPDDGHPNLLKDLNIGQSDINVKEQEPKPHLHAPDEPQSYIQGEDSQVKHNIETNFKDAIAQNVPLALALNGNSQGNNGKNNPKVEGVNSNIQNNAASLNTLYNKAQNNINNQNNNVVLNRQKREVVDCTEKSSLQPEDKEICKTLVDPIDPPRLKLNIADNDNDFLPKVDFSNVNSPLDTNVIHHISRSLKNVDENNDYNKR